MAIVRDKYDRERAARLLSYMMAISGIMPIIGPAIGGILITYSSWPAGICLYGYFALMILVTFRFFLRETLPEKDMNALKPFHLAMNFKTMLQDPKFLAYTACTSFGRWTYMLRQPSQTS